MAPDTAQGLRITLSIMSGTWPLQKWHLVVAGLNSMSQTCIFASIAMFQVQTLCTLCLLDSPDDTVYNCLLESKVHTGVVTRACFQPVLSY